MTENEKITINGKEVTLYREVETNLYRFSKDAVDMLLEALEEREQYRAIGTIEEFKDLKEKSEPKKPYYVQYDGNPKIGNPHCSNCCGIINNGGTSKGMHCKWCGQKLDWSE